jgi:hypothetical protein
VGLKGTLSQPISSDLNVCEPWLGHDEVSYALERGQTSSVHLEKAWHGLHFLLTGSAGESGVPLGFLLEGGQEVGPGIWDEEEEELREEYLSYFQELKKVVALAAEGGMGLLVTLS